MLPWVIVKARIDGSLNLNEHCVACDDENNCLRGQPCGANPAIPKTSLHKSQRYAGSESGYL